MVGAGIAFLWLALAVGAFAGPVPAPDSTYCIGRTAGYGRTVSAMWCGSDSCFRIRYQPMHRDSGSVGIWGMAVDPSKWKNGYRLMRAAVALNGWVMRRDFPVVSLSLGDSQRTFFTNLPQNQSRIRDLKTFEAGIDSALVPLGVDSLVVSGGKRGTRTALFRLAHSGPKVRQFTDAGSMTLRWSKSRMPKDTSKEDPGWDGESKLPRRCAESLIKGKECAYTAPKGIRRIQGILKATGEPGISRPALEACLDREFEMVSPELEI